jgi:hypothetical protein
VFPLPTRFAPVILPFAGLFRQRTWRHARALLVGAILTPGVRTVASVLRLLGLARERRFCRYHRVLSRAVWSSQAASRLLLGLLVRAFVPTGPVLVGLDDTIERRRGARIRAKGIYRDPVRSSHSHFVKAMGLRWLSVMLLAPIRGRGASGRSRSSRRSRLRNGTAPSTASVTRRCSCGHASSCARSAAGCPVAR